MNLLCPWEPAKYLIFSANVPSILYYALIPGMVISLLFSIYVFSRDKKNLSSLLLLFVSIFFFIWGFLDLILFATNDPQVVMFFWSVVILVEPLIYICALYLAYTFFTKKDVSFYGKLILSAMILPVIVILSTKYNLLGVNLGDCTAIESTFIIFYTYGLEILISIAIIFFAIKKNRASQDTKQKKEITYFTIGLALFLLALSSGNIIGSFTDNWVLSQLGYFGMPIFVGFLGYLIVRYKSFNVKLIATQALVWGLAALIGAQFFFVKVTINYFLTGITFIATIIFGQMLIKSVKVEIEQKEELAKLNVDLQNLLKQRESLVHLVTHKVKGSFTHTKYLFAGMLDGMFGPLTPELKKAADLGMESDNNGVATVDLILNASNLQKGTVKYDMKPTNFKELVEKTFEEKKEQAEKKGLKIEKEITSDDCTVNGDVFWLKEVVHNFIENSIRYTKAGTVTVGLKKENGKVIYFVRDTGVGVTDEDKKNLFTEGGRGANSVKVNVDSTGYGLYTVKLVVEAHGGRVWVESDGQDKGSTFFAELSAV